MERMLAKKKIRNGKNKQKLQLKSNKLVKETHAQMALV